MQMTYYNVYFIFVDVPMNFIPWTLVFFIKFSNEIARVICYIAKQAINRKLFWNTLTSQLNIEQHRTSLLYMYIYKSLKESVEIILVYVTYYMAQQPNCYKNCTIT